LDHRFENRNSLDKRRGNGIYDARGHVIRHDGDRDGNRGDRACRDGGVHGRNRRNHFVCGAGNGAYDGLQESGGRAR
jgi:hypothetical protein